MRLSPRGGVGASPSSLPAAMPNTPIPFPKPLRIAVVDDHQSTRLAMCRLLEEQGYTACHFGSVKDFIGSHEKAGIACLISDVRMPGIDGISLYEGLQKTNFTFPVIFCTGQELDERLHRTLDKGVAALLLKPISPEALLKAVKAACTPGNHRTSQAEH